MKKVKIDGYFKRLLAANGINVLVKDIKSVNRYEIPGTFKEIYHRIIFDITMKSGKRYEILQETRKNGVFSLNSAIFETVSIKEV